MKQFKKIAIAVVGTVLFFVVLDLVGGLVCDKLYHDAKYSLFARQNYVLNESKDDIIIIGSSRASHHYIPSIFTDSLGMSCYNAGSDGMCIYYHYGAMSAMIERGHKPKLVIYEVMDLDVQKSKGATFGLDAACDRLALNYGEYESINEIIDLRGWTEKIKLHSNLYRYNSQLVQLLNCNFVPSKESRGYEQLSGVMPFDAKMNEGHNDDEIESLKEKYFVKLIQLLKDNNITLIMVQSPYYSNVVADGITRAKEIAQDCNITFYDLKNVPELMKPELFKDEMHLNHDGATLFSQMIVGLIQDSYTKQ